MNDILQLKGTFDQRSRKGKVGPRNLPAGKTVTVEKIDSLITDLLHVQNYWSRRDLLSGVLVNVTYIQTLAKSNRLSTLFSGDGKRANDTIVGAKFSNDLSKKHIITHYISKSVLQETIQKLEICKRVLASDFGGSISSNMLEKVNNNAKLYKSRLMNRSPFANVIVDSYYAESFNVQDNVDAIGAESIVTIYDTDPDIEARLLAANIDLRSTQKLNETTLLLYPDDFKRLKDYAPYLIAMITTDLSSYTSADFEVKKNVRTIPLPGSEPTIGVIDTLFSSDVYFSKWVDSTNMVGKDIEVTQDDFFHGTAVSSILVDGPALNADLDDGCGRFRVRHFAVATGGVFSSFSVLKAIKNIVIGNPDIKVWNLSLGSDLSINENFISPEAAELDSIQFENDVIFVIAGTNSKNKERGRIGAPADSINALVVNSVDENELPASYSREGPVLAFFHKPDVSCFGGDDNKKVKVFVQEGEAYVKGTSFAAPWVARKLAFLIHIMGFSREVAKALIIDSAAGWCMDDDPSNVKGFGIVPQRIEQILQTPEDEIKFTIMGVSEMYDTYSYKIPVPIVKEKQPFVSKATLCYFPKCTRNQGVDYTNTELSLSFGRIDDNGIIKTINDNKQDTHCVYEDSARKYYRKWDNVKHIYEEPKDRAVAKMVYGNGSWAISIKTKERLRPRDGTGIHFGLVITLKEMFGANRMDDFFALCQLRGWAVARVDVENQLELYTKAEEEVDFDD